MLIFEANLEQRPATVFRLNPFSCFAIIRRLTKKKKKTFGSINSISNQWGLNKIWHFVGNHTPPPYTSNASIFSSIDSSFVAMDEGTTLRPPPNIDNWRIKGGGPFEWPKCEFESSICMRFDVKMKNNVISHPSPPPSLRLQSPMLQLPPFSPDNRSISLKKRPQRLEGKKVSRFG